MSGKSFAEGGASTFVLGAVFAGLYVIRRPDMVFYPQLWAEDGGFFLHAALTGKMLREFNGYFHLAPQAAAWLASLVPRYAPHVITAIAVLIHVLTGLYFVSPRFAFLLEKRLHRILMVVLFTLGHTCWETRGNMANIQWLLLVLLALVVADHWNAETSGGDAVAKSVVLATGALSSLVPAGLGLFVVAAALCSIRVKSWRPRAGLGAFFISWPMAVFYGAVVAHVTWALTSASHFVSGPPPVWSWATVHAWCLAMLVGMPYNTVATMFVPERLYTAYAAAPYPSVIAVSFWLLLAAALVEIRRRRGAVPGALIAALVLVLLYCLMLSVTKYDFLANVGRIDGLNRYAERYWLAPYALSLYAVFRIGELLAAERRFRGLLSAGMAMMVIVVLFNATNLHPYQNFHWPSQAEKIVRWKKTGCAERGIPARGAPDGQCETVRIPINPPGWYIVLEGQPRTAP